MWWEFCTPINTVLLYARGVLDRAARHPKAQRHKGKYCLNKALAEIEGYITRLYHSGFCSSYDMFSLEGKIECERQWYCDDVPQQEFFDYWCTIGCEGYHDIIPFYTCLENKIKQMMIKFGDGCKTESSELITVCYLCTTFNFNLKKSIEGLKRETHLDVSHYFSHYSMTPLLHFCDQLGRELYGAMRIAPDNIMYDNISAGIQDILDRWSNYATPMRNAAIVTPDFRHIFRTKGYMMKQIDEYNRLADEIEKAERLLKNQKQNEKRNRTETVSV